VQTFAADEAAAEAELRGGQTAGFTGGGLVHARDFKQHVSREHDSDPKFRCAFTLTHSNFRWTLSNGLVGENADEDLTFALQETRDSDAAGFDVDVLDPSAVKRLETEIAEVQLIAAGGVATAIATLVLAIFNSAGKKGHSLGPVKKGLVQK